MSRPLKIFRITLNRRQTDPVAQHYAGTRFEDCRQIEAVVAAATKKEAITLLGITSSEANGYLHSMSADRGHNVSTKVALSKPGQVFARPANCWSDDAAYFEIERSPHVPIPRVKRRSFAEVMAARENREFTREELTMIMERFEMSNDPMGKSIADKARLHIG